MRNLRLFTKSPSDFTTASVRNLRFKRSLFWPAVLSGMVVLLTIVAGLQYRWTSQITEATDAQLRSSVQSLMTDWHLDLYRELSAICVALQVGPDAGARDEWKDYLQRYADWTGTAANKDLVENVYIWEVSQRAKPQLLRLDVGASQIVPTNVPKNLENLLARLQANSSSLAVALSAWEFRDSSSQRLSRPDEGRPSAHPVSSDALTGWQFDANIPVIVHPIVHHAVPDNSNSAINMAAVDWIVVVPNFSTIQKRILPELAQRYFGGPRGLEYNSAVIAAGSAPRLIYSSDAGFASQGEGAAEATMNIFGPTPEDMGGHFRQAANAGSALKGVEWHSFSGPVWFPTIQYTSRQDPWVLALQHRNGRLQAVANNVKHRNLAISALILLLLAANMGLVTVASLRAHNFARLQMEFLASFSHELRTPITAILSAGENIKDGFVSGQSTPKHYGSIVTGQARQLIDLVDRILLFASIRSGKNQYKLCPLQISEILQHVRKSTAELIKEAGYTVEEQVEPGLPCVFADLFAVCGCLENLITNAIKYSGKNSRICISAAVDETNLQKKEIMISVQDYGMGISSSDLPHIFEPFYRSPEVTAAQIHGTGLGLFLATHLAEAMGGRLSVVSEVGVGSIFTLHLPAAKKEDLILSAARSDEVLRNA